jgi:hypothetical protein
MGGGGGKGKGGTGGTITPPPGMMSTAENLGNIGAYESQFLNQPYSLGNWAMNYATGGQGPQATQNPTGPGPQTGWFSQDVSGIEPSAFSSGSTVQTYGKGGRENFYTGQPYTGQGGGINPGISVPGGTNLALGPNGPSSGSNPMLPSGSQGAGGFPNLLSQYGQALSTEQQIAGSPAPGTSYADIQNMDTQLQGDINQFGKDWLTPQQNAMINQQTKAAQAQTAQQLGSEGLSGSTMGTELSGELGLAGTAAKGQLQQGNMQLVQNWQKMMMGEQEFGLQDQQQFANLAQQIAASSAGEQSTLWQEGTQGYNLMNTFMNAVTAPYGLQIQDFGDILQAETSVTTENTQAAAQAAASGGSSASSAISSIASIAVAFA